MVSFLWMVGNGCLKNTQKKSRTQNTFSFLGNYIAILLQSRFLKETMINELSNFREGKNLTNGLPKILLQILETS